MRLLTYVLALVLLLMLMYVLVDYSSGKTNQFWPETSQLVISTVVIALLYDLSETITPRRGNHYFSKGG